MRFRRFALALAAVAMLVPAAARADDSQRAAWLLPTARAAWPAAACAGREQIVTGPEADQIIGAGPPPPAGSTILGEGLASYPDCRVAIRTGLSDYMFCAVLTHELGHIAGFEHTDADRFPIMAAVLALDYEPCLTATAPRLFVFGRRLHRHKRKAHR